MSEHKWLLSLLGITPPDSQDTTVTATTHSTAVTATSNSSRLVTHSDSSTLTDSSSGSIGNNAVKTATPVGEGKGGCEDQSTAMILSEGNGEEQREGREAEAEAEVVTYGDLFACVAAASSLSADFEELR